MMGEHSRALMGSSEHQLAHDFALHPYVLRDCDTSMEGAELNFLGLLNGSPSWLPDAPH